MKLTERATRKTEEVSPISAEEISKQLGISKEMLPNSTIVLSMWFTIRSNSFTEWDISFILQKLLHSSMIHFPLNSGVISLNLHEYGMAC